MRLALFQPDIPQNAGNMMRLAACLGVGVDIIGPCGFVLDDRRLRRAQMDYGEGLDLRRFESWLDFEASRRDQRSPPRLVVLTTAGSQRHLDFDFDRDDILLVGRESAGLPNEVHAAADARLVIPMTTGKRSLNVATAAAIALGEAMRQTIWQGTAAT